MSAFIVFALAALASLTIWGKHHGRPPSFESTRTEVGIFRRGLGAPEGESDGRDKRRHWPSHEESSRAPEPGVASVPLLLELLGTALDSGLTIQGALRAVAHVATPNLQSQLMRVVAGLDIGASWKDSWEGQTAHADIAQIHDALSFGAITGASSAALLYAEAQRLRKTASRRAEKRAAALGVKLVLPLGLCSLPAFIALGIVPVVMAMIPDF
ncbi:type II secretion system F family protein [Arthrobacter psychrolactophilus]